MQVIFYSTTSPVNKVDKALTQIATVECIVNDAIDIEDPRLKMVWNPAYIDSNVNYCYIPDFKRYYFVEPKIIDGKIEYLECHTDRLMTFKAGIRNISCTIERTAERGKMDGYLIDNQYVAKAYKQVTTYDFPTGMDDFTTILMTVG